MAAFNIAALFEKAFGYSAPYKFEVPTATEPNSTSSLGQPYYGVDDLGREHFLPVKLNGWLLPFAVISINTKKTIVRTPMPERGGSVIEVVSIDDYAINIKGIFINNDNAFPEADIKKLQEQFRINESLELRSALTDIFLRGGNKENEGNIAQLHRVVISDINYPPVSGVQHAKPFEINCVSDMIFKLTL